MFPLHIVAEQCVIAHNSYCAKLMDIHGDNSFKSKSYANAAFTIDKLPVELSELPEEKIADIKGIGDAIGNKNTIIAYRWRIATFKRIHSKNTSGCAGNVENKRAWVQKRSIPFGKNWK